MSTDLSLTNSDDTVTSVVQPTSKIEGLRGDDTITVPIGADGAYLVGQIDGDQGDDTLSGADLIYGGAGDDEIDNAQVAYGFEGDDAFGSGVITAYGGDGNDTFSLVEGSYAELGDGGGRFNFENTGVQHDESGYAIVNFSIDENGGAARYDDPFVLLYFDEPLFDTSGSGGFSAVRILDGETDDPTKHLLISTVVDYDVIVMDYFVSETSDAPAGTVFVEFRDTIPEDFQFDSLTSGNITGAPVALPIYDILSGSIMQSDLQTLEDITLTEEADDFTSSDNNLGKIEGLKGSDEIIITGQYAAQIDGDQGSDILSGGEVIYGGSGIDQISNFDTAFGGRGDDVFFLTAGSSANDVEGSNTYVLDTGPLSGDQPPYAFIKDDGSQDPGGIIISRAVVVDVSTDDMKFSRIIEDATNEPTRSVLFDFGGDYDVIIDNFFLSDTDDSYDERFYFVGTPINFNQDALFFGDLSFDTITLPLEEISPTKPDTSLDDTLTGSSQDDHLEGFDGDDRLFGFAGDDRLEGDQGDDRVFGGAGDDVVFGGAGDNRLDGGAGDDTIYARGDTDTVWGDKGSDIIHADADQTVIAMEGIGDYAAEDEVDTVHNFDLGTDKVVITDLEFDAAGAASFLADNASIEGADLVLDLGDGRSIKMIDIVVDEDNQTEEDFAEIFVF